MALYTIILLGLLSWSVNSAPTNEAVDAKIAAPAQANQDKDDLNTDASTYSRGYPSYQSGYQSGYGITGYGLDDRRGYGIDKYSGYSGGYNGYSDYADGNRYNNYNGYRGYDGYGTTGYSGYSGNGGYGGYTGTGGYGGYGGYGGNGGNGGINSYYGYNNAQYPSSNHLGFGYYNRPGYGNIYNSGVTPSLVTGYRGYTRR